MLFLHHNVKIVNSILAVLFSFQLFVHCSSTDAVEVEETSQSKAFSRDELKQQASSVFGEPKSATRLLPDERIWVDAKRGLVIIDGYVALQKGQLEMFACPAGTKEHESIVALFVASRHVHAALLAAGANTGTPTRFEPYRPATGQTIKVNVLWKDPAGKNQTATAQSWIKELRSGKEMPFDWVFAGSSFYKDDETGNERYLADAGELICVANFPTATLDLAIESVAANSSLNFVAFTERIPERFTVVRVVLRVSDDPPMRSIDRDSPEAKTTAKDDEAISSKEASKDKASKGVVGADKGSVRKPESPKNDPKKPNVKASEEIDPEEKARLDELFEGLEKRKDR